MFFITVILVLLGQVTSHALPAAAESSATTSSAPAVPTTCGDLFRDLADFGNYVPAKSVYDCFVTVPFNPAVATRLVRYYQDTLQFQANFDYLASPPPSYQQPAVDLLAGLHSIQETIDSGGFINEYQFESALQNLLYSANDPHLAPSLGLLSSFQFGSAYGLTAISEDGIAPPEIYLVDDIFDYQTDSSLNPSWRPSPITKINGTDVEEFLTRFAALNSHGSVEPHADWNQIFENPVRDAFVSGFSLFGGGATFYPGDDLVFEFLNHTVFNTRWIGAYGDFPDTGPLETGGDFYNFFVLGIPPASLQTPNLENATFAPENTLDSDDSNSFSSNGINDLYFSSSGAFPEYVDILQENRTYQRYVTGYLLNGSANAVLSLPTFEAYDDSVVAFSNAVEQFISQAKAAGKAKIIIDLQQNNGGDELLAYSTFRNFFPDREPFGASNLRRAPYVNATGRSINAWFEGLSAGSSNKSAIAANDWIVVNRINTATGRLFTSWDEFYSGGGPLSTGNQQYNTSDTEFDAAVLGTPNIPAALTLAPHGQAPFAASDILILSDAACTSTCALFVEMMHFEAGVKTVVIGGRPEPGPMQTVGGSRGASLMYLEDLDAVINFAKGYGGPGTDLLPDRDNLQFQGRGGLTLQNQVRRDDATPVQMLYDAADCRIQITWTTFYNLTSLWTYAADAIWTNSSLCVPGSTGFAVSSASAQADAAPQRNIPSSLPYTEAGILHVSFPDGSELPPSLRPAPDAGFELIDPPPLPLTPVKPPLPVPAGSSSVSAIKRTYVGVKNTPGCGKSRKRQGGGGCELVDYGSPHGAWMEGFQLAMTDVANSNNLIHAPGPAYVSQDYRNGYNYGFLVATGQRDNRQSGRPTSASRANTIVEGTRGVKG